MWDAIAITPDGTRFAIVSADRRVRIFSTTKRNKISLMYMIHDWFVSDLCFTPDGRHLLTASDEVLRIWTMDTGVIEYENSTMVQIGGSWHPKETYPNQRTAMQAYDACIGKGLTMDDGERRRYLNFIRACYKDHEPQNVREGEGKIIKLAYKLTSYIEFNTQDTVFVGTFMPVTKAQLKEFETWEQPTQIIAKVLLGAFPHS